MGTPVIRVNSLSPEYETFEETFFAEPNLDGKRKGKDYKNLGQLLRQCSFPYAQDHDERFWPYGLLEQILTQERVIEELGDYIRTYPGVYNKRTIGNYTEKILSPREPGKRYIKIFAILVLIGMGPRINDFIREGVCDEDVPLVKGKADPDWDLMLSRKDSPTVQVECLSEWEFHERDFFYRRQRFVDVIPLGLNPDRSIRHEKLDNRVVLPWVSYRKRESGGYGDVYRAKAPARCHTFHNALDAIDFRDTFAVKELRAKDEKKMKEQEVDFWKEVEMLKRFSGTFHDHLVTLLMTWSIEDRHYFLFPWADCDLELYWENDANRLPIDPVTREMDMDAMRWLSSQVLGLTKALHLIHNPSHLGLKPEELKYGRHGDIKAQNILYYPSRKYPRGILVIADFGLGAFNSDKSRSNIPGEKIPGTPHYRPPECDLAGGTISRSFDIWTYGCLLLELVCWALGGNDKLEDFHEYRYTPYITGSESDIFFDVQQKGEGKKYVVKVKEKVSEYIVKLHAELACTQYFHDLLDLIENEMIIVLTPEKERIRSPELVREIETMDRKVNDTRNPDFGANYCQRKCPEARTVKPSVAFEAELNDTAKGNVQKHRGDGLDVHKGEVRKSKDPDELKAMERAF